MLRLQSRPLRRKHHEQQFLVFRLYHRLSHGVQHRHPPTQSLHDATQHHDCLMA